MHEVARHSLKEQCNPAATRQAVGVQQYVIKRSIRTRDTPDSVSEPPCFSEEPRASLDSEQEERATQPAQAT